MSDAAGNAKEVVSQDKTATTKGAVKTAPTAAEREAEKQELRRRLEELELEQGSPQHEENATAAPSVADAQPPVSTLPASTGDAAPAPVLDTASAPVVNGTPAAKVDTTPARTADNSRAAAEETAPISKAGDEAGELAADQPTEDRAIGGSTDSDTISVVQPEGSAPGDHTAVADSTDSAKRDEGDVAPVVPSGVSDKNETSARRSADRKDDAPAVRSPNRASTVAQTNAQARPAPRRVIPPSRREAFTSEPALLPPARRETVPLLLPRREESAPPPARTGKNDSDSDAMEEAQVDQTIDAEGGSETNDEQDELQDMTVSDARIESQFIARMIGSYAGLGGRTGPRVSDDDWPVTGELMAAWLAIEGNQGLMGIGRDVPDHTIDSLYHWARRRERPAVLDEPEDVEEDYGDRVAHFWLAIRSELAGDVLDMVGQNGLSTFIQALMQWRPVEPDTNEWMIVVQDVTTGLRALRTASEADLNVPLGGLISRVDKRRAANAVGILEDRASSVTGNSGWVPARPTPARRSAGANTVKREPKAAAKTRNARAGRRADSAAPPAASRNKKRRREDDSEDEGAAGPSRGSGARTRNTRPRKSGGRT